MRTRITVVGTGLTSLTIARRLVSHRPPLPIILTIIDKARAPGGRLTSRDYPRGRVSSSDEASNSEQAVTLETGARVFQSTTKGFHAELETYAHKDWIKEVSQSQIRGVTERDGFPVGTRWWESSRGSSSGLIERIVDDITQEAVAGGIPVTWNFNTTVLPAIGDVPNLDLRTDPPLQQDMSIEQESAGPVGYLVHTAPSPQIAALFPLATGTESRTTKYLENFCLLLPTIDVPDLPIYHRNPSPSLTSIFTGTVTPSGASAGLVVQATPRRLGLSYSRDKNPDEKIRSAFVDALRREGATAGIGADVVDRIETITRSETVGREAQVKRWKYAQVDAPPVEQGSEMSSGRDTSSAKAQFTFTRVHQEVAGEQREGHLIIAGDGQSIRGGVEGAWESGRDVAEWIIARIRAEPGSGSN